MQYWESITLNDSVDIIMQVLFHTLYKYVKKTEIYQYYRSEVQNVSITQSVKGLN